MGLQTLQQLIESQFTGACVSVDLLRIASTVAGPYQGRVALSLVVDAECCLDRLYGGYVSGNIAANQCLQRRSIDHCLLQIGHVVANGTGCCNS